MHIYEIVLHSFIVKYYYCVNALCAIYDNIVSYFDPEFPELFKIIEF